MAEKTVTNKIISFWASLRLSCVLFFLLFLLTVLGTLDQKELGLYATQKKYFESIYLIYQIGPLPILLPGVYLVLIFLFINTIVGTFKRIPFKPSKYGIYIIHFSMLLLFAGSFVTFKFSDDGQMTLQEGETSSKFVSYHEWEIAIIDINQPEQNVETIFDLNFDHQMIGSKFTDTNIPFTFEILEASRNAIVRPKGPMIAVESTIVNGYFIKPLARDAENERNIPALLLNVTDKKNQSQKIILSGETDLKHSLQLNSDGKVWVIALRKKSWELPFAITLDRVVRDLYPGTMQAQAYKSFVRKLEDNTEEKKEIYMNHPLRHKGFIFFQSGYMEDPNTNIKLSTFAVVQNPTDQVPLIACILIGIGMTIHFGALLFNFIQREKAI
jgi:hypothetical protein